MKSNDSSQIPIYNNLTLLVLSDVENAVDFFVNYHSRKQQQLSQADVTDIIAPVYKKESSEMIKSILDIATEEGWLKGRIGKPRFGYTLLEILVSVSLMLMIMYAVAAIFGRVGTIINETQSTMAMANNLRNVGKRLEKDLQQVSVPLIPPRNSGNNEGYFCYIEGLGASHARVESLNRIFTAKDIAWDEDRSNATGIVSDTTVGDMDDILMFTAKAPAGEYFRGRTLRPTYDVSGNVDGCNEIIVESEYAEIVWFLRGTTLYRRVLLILPQEMLEEGLQAADWLAANPPPTEPVYSVQLREQNYNGTTNTYAASPLRLGYGLFRYFDVSVHLENFDHPTVHASTGTSVQRVVCNTLGDLSNRKNRYGYWASVFDNWPQVDSGYSDRTSLHGFASAWYWLRLPTLQESAMLVRDSADYSRSFRAGSPFGYRYFNDLNSLNTANNLNVNQWPGWYLRMSTISNAAVISPLAANLPESANPFLDYWNAPNSWDVVESNSGDLSVALKTLNANFNDTTLDQDVILTNVLSFDVQAWDENTKQFVSLATDFNLGTPPTVVNGITLTLPERKDILNSYRKDFKTVGEYKPWYFNSTANSFQLNTASTFLPAIYDTWTEQYQMEYAQWARDYHDTAPTPANYRQMHDLEAVAASIPSAGKISAASLPDFPPPYDLRLKAIQIEIRVFDPRSQHIRNMTFPVEFPAW